MDFAIVDLFSVRHYYRSCDKPRIRVLLPSAIIGILLGAIFFGVFHDYDRTLRIGVGLLALAFLA